MTIMDLGEPGEVGWGGAKVWGPLVKHRGAILFLEKHASADSKTRPMMVDLAGLLSYRGRSYATAGRGGM